VDLTAVQRDLESVFHLSTAAATLALLPALLLRVSTNSAAARDVACQQITEVAGKIGQEAYRQALTVKEAQNEIHVLEQIIRPLRITDPQQVPGH
jgi:hypothetical protein